MVDENSKTKKNLTNEYQLDTSIEIMVVLAIEMPFWIPIESGEYSPKKNCKVKIRNDLWYVATANLVDGPIDQAFDYIVNEVQVDDNAFLERFTGKTAQYYHKKKMKTTFTRSLSFIPYRGKVTAQPISEEWQHQIIQVAFGLLEQQSKLEELLDDINLFIDHYCTLISPQNQSLEVRRVNYYETMVNVRLDVKTEHFHYIYRTKIAPDMKMSDVPFPPFRVCSDHDLDMFRRTIRDLKEPSFHQLHWFRALNHKREKRYLEALFDAAVTLETLVHLYLTPQYPLKNDRERTIGKKRGLAGWVKDLKPQGLTEEGGNVAELWKLRNEIIHEQKLLSEEDIQTIRKGIHSLGKVRAYLLKTVALDVLNLESKFSSFLEPIPQGRVTSGLVGKLVAMEFGWRREKDHYQIVIVPSDKSSLRDRIRRWLRRKS